MRLAMQAGKHHVVQRSFEAILRLIELLDRDKEGDEKPLDEMDEEELHESMTRTVVRIIFDRPDAGVAILEELGWKLEPPDEPLEEAALPSVCEAVDARLPGLFPTRSG
jgi:hypothetical protein